MTRYSKLMTLAVAALVLTLLSSVLPGRVITRNPGGLGCTSGYAHSCEVVAGGWPFPYLVDSLHFPPGGSVSLFDAWLLGLDEIWYDALLASFVCWLGLAVVLVRLYRWRQQGKPPGRRS